MPSDNPVTVSADVDGAEELRRQLGICNLCCYCNGLCPVFSAAERRPRLRTADLDHLANLCHHCRSCLYDCQYAPPHVFAVNLPRALAHGRVESYGRYAWPRPLGALLVNRPGWLVRIAIGIVSACILFALALVPAETLFSVHTGAGAFYRIIPLSTMIAGASLSLGLALLAIGIGVRRFWRASGPSQPLRPAAVGSALWQLLTLRHLSGGGPGCADMDHRPSHRRRGFHHLLFYGFLATFAATLAAAVQHHVLGQQAPYPLTSVPVLLGVLGGLAMLFGGAGLIRLRRLEDRTPTDPGARAGDLLLLWLLLAVAGSGLLLLALRTTALMGMLLTLHLGTVLAFFLLLPYTKMVHGAYRGAALLREVLEADKP